ncbi:MAG: ABC transporter permease [Sporichthyaceae bacterium]
MTTQTLPARVPVASGPPGFFDAVRAEWTKLRSVRSSVWTILVALAVGIGLSALVSALAANDYANSGGSTENWDPTAISTFGGVFAQLAIAVLGTLVVTSEYATRSIRTSLQAVPRRGRLLGAKAIVVGTVALAVGMVMAFGSFLIGQALISGKAPTASLSDAGVLRAVAGVGLYFAAVALLGMALGALLRSTAGAVTALVAMLFVLPGVVQALPESLREPLTMYWPTIAGSQITATVQTPDMLGPWAGFAVMLTAVAAIGYVAFWRLTRTDA